MSLKTSVPKPLKVGFDLDGVILYNPIRIFRPFISTFKRDILKIKKTKFKIPRTPFEKKVFTLLHKTSLFIAPGYSDLIQLIKDGKIEAYLITGRFSFLKKDTQVWLQKMNATQYFKQWYYNRHDEQPHLYKANLIKKLKLDYFVEDNWDIVKYVQKAQPQTKVLWVYNFLDSHIKYPFKFTSLRESLKHIINPK
jgi:hypothetical protein